MRGGLQLALYALDRGFGDAPFSSLYLVYNLTRDEKGVARLEELRGYLVDLGINRAVQFKQGIRVHEEH